MNSQKQQEYFYEVVHDAVDALRRRHTVDFDTSIVAKVVRRADGEYVNIGTFDYNPANDALMTVEITDMEMKAYMAVREPGPGGAEIPPLSPLIYPLPSAVPFPEF